MVPLGLFGGYHGVIDEPDELLPSANPGGRVARSCGMWILQNLAYDPALLRTGREEVDLTRPRVDPDPSVYPLAEKWSLGNAVRRLVAALKSETSPAM